MCSQKRAISEATFNYEYLGQWQIYTRIDMKDIEKCRTEDM